MSNGDRGFNGIPRKIRRLRWVIFGACAWFILCIILPDYVMGITQYRNVRLNAVLDGLSIVVLVAATAFTMFQIRTITTVIRPVLAGLILLMLAQVFRILGTMQFFLLIPDGFLRDFIYATCMELPNGVGMVLFLGGLFYAIIELLGARHTAEAEREQLLEEMVNREMAEKTIAEQRLRLVATARLSSLGAMASGLAHEINNPLAIISAGCQQLESLLTNGKAEAAQVARVFEVLNRNVNRIESIVRGLRNLSREGASDPLTESPVRQIVDDTLELCRSRFLKNGIVLNVPEIAPELLAYCRPTQIAQVLLNLLNNAFDAVSEAEERWVNLEIASVKNAVEIAVVDSGPGLRPEVRDRVFDPFYTTKRAGAGVGLGLSISKRIMEMHDGDLYLDARCPHTRFVIHLPQISANTVAERHVHAQV